MFALFLVAYSSFSADFLREMFFWQKKKKVTLCAGGSRLIIFHKAASDHDWYASP